MKVNGWRGNQCNSRHARTNATMAEYSHSMCAHTDFSRKMTAPLAATANTEGRCCDVRSHIRPGKWN
eukprot:15468323-Alexandrium_andersonii.AAC.1